MPFFELCIFFFFVQDVATTSILCWKHQILLFPVIYVMHSIIIHTVIRKTVGKVKYEAVQIPYIHVLSTRDT